MNERGWLTVEELVKIIDQAIDEKIISAIEGEEILWKVQTFVDHKRGRDQNRYKSVDYKFGTKW